MLEWPTSVSFLSIPAMFVLNITPSVNFSSYPRVFVLIYFLLVLQLFPEDSIFTPQGWKNTTDWSSTLTFLEKLPCEQLQLGISWDKELLMLLTHNAPFSSQT